MARDQMEKKNSKNFVSMHFFNDDKWETDDNYKFTKCYWQSPIEMGVHKILQLTRKWEREMIDILLQWLLLYQSSVHEIHEVYYKWRTHVHARRHTLSPPWIHQFRLPWAHEIAINSLFTVFYYQLIMVSIHSVYLTRSVQLQLVCICVSLVDVCAGITERITHCQRIW